MANEILRESCEMFQSTLFGRYSAINFSDIQDAPQAILAQAFGTSHDNSSVNAQIHNVALDFAQKLFELTHEKVPIFVQSPDIPTEFAPDSSEFATVHKLKAPASTASGGGTTSTRLYEMARQQYSEIYNIELAHIAIAGQAHHLGRLKFLGQKVLGFSRVDLIAHAPKTFDKNSAQFWTRNRLSWLTREIPYDLLLTIEAFVKKLHKKI